MPGRHAAIFKRDETNLLYAFEYFGFSPKSSIDQILVRDSR